MTGKVGRERWLRAAALYVALSAAALVVLFPFVWMLITALRQPGTEFDPGFFPKHPTLENVKRVFTEFGFVRYFLNSSIVAVTAALFATLFASLAAWSKKPVAGSTRNLPFAPFCI